MVLVNKQMVILVGPAMGRGIFPMNHLSMNGFNIVVIVMEVVNPSKPLYLQGTKAPRILFLQLVVNLFSAIDVVGLGKKIGKGCFMSNLRSRKQRCHFCGGTGLVSVP